MRTGRTQKTTVQVGETGVVYTVRPRFRGAPEPVTFSIVNGKQSYNNADFSVNPATGELSLNVAFVSPNKSKFVRVRYETADGARVEKSIKFRSVTDKAPTIGGDLEYDSGVTVGQVVGTVTSTFPNATFILVGRESSGVTPATPEQSQQAFNLVQTGANTADIQWSGRVSAGPEYDFAITVTNRDTDGCICGEAEADIIFASVAPMVVCGPETEKPLLVTASWTGSATLYLPVDCPPDLGSPTYFWTNGETKKVYPFSFEDIISPTPSYGVSRQRWERDQGGANKKFNFSVERFVFSFIGYFYTIEQQGISLDEGFNAMEFAIRKQVTDFGTGTTQQAFSNYGPRLLSSLNDPNLSELTYGWNGGTIPEYLKQGSITADQTGQGNNLGVVTISWEPDGW